MACWNWASPRRDWRSTWPASASTPAGKLADERYMTFFNQPRTPCGGVEARPGGSGDLAAFALQLGRLPSGIDRLVVTASIDGGGVMSQLQAGHVRLQAGGRELAASPSRAVISPAKSRHAA
jgi:stress response protein SCP2